MDMLLIIANNIKSSVHHLFVFTPARPHFANIQNLCFNKLCWFCLTKPCFYSSLLTNETEISHSALLFWCFATKCGHKHVSKYSYNNSCGHKRRLL